jgi:hypothetical protein
VWVGFWLVIATLVLSIIDARTSFSSEFGSFAAIVLTPPIALLALGAVCRLVFETVGPSSRRPASD